MENITVTLPIEEYLAMQSEIKTLSDKNESLINALMGYMTIDPKNPLLRLNQYENLQTIDKYTYDTLMAEKEELKNRFLDVRAMYERTTVSVFKYDLIKNGFKNAEKRISDLESELEKLKSKWYVKLFS